MMKKLFTIALLLPLLVSAQTEIKEKPLSLPPRNEIGLNTGPRFTLLPNVPYPFLTTTLRYMRNFMYWQGGVQLQSNNYGFFDHSKGENFAAYELGPALVFNGTLHNGNHIFYAGITAGYMFGRTFSKKYGASGKMNTYNIGIQGGYTYHTGDHFSVNFETMLQRRSGKGEDITIGHAISPPYYIYKEPVVIKPQYNIVPTLGIRYRF